MGVAERVCEMLCYSRLFAGISKSALSDSIKSIVDGDISLCYESGLNSEQINEIVRAVNFETDNFNF